MMRVPAVGLLLVLVFAGCTTKPQTPMGRLDYLNPGIKNGRSRKLLVFLRGFGGGNEIFKKKGAVDEVFNRDLPFDIVAPDAHFGYYKYECLGVRLHEDIIKPARARGYEEIWIAGTSMGGMGALFYLTDYPKGVDGVILLSPFLGWGGIIKEIRKAGGVATWEPGPHTVKDWQRYLWAWIRKYRQSPENYPPIYHGYGDSDFFRKSQQLFAETIPKGRTIVVAGGHTYGTLKRLWKAQLDKLDAELRR